MERQIKNKTDGNFEEHSPLPVSLLYLEKELKFFKPWVIGAQVENQPSLKTNSKELKKQPQKDNFKFMP